MWTAPSDTHAPGKQNSTPIMDRQLFCPPSSFSPLRSLSLSLSLSSFAGLPSTPRCCNELGHWRHHHPGHRLIQFGVVELLGFGPCSLSAERTRDPRSSTGAGTLRNRLISISRGSPPIRRPLPVSGSRRKACSSLLNLQRVDFESCALHA